jgi:hypothetical protein
MSNRQSEISKQEGAHTLTFNTHRFWTLFVGISVLIVWVLLFTVGTNVDSKYYRAAISFHYDEPLDWFMTVISFTLTNVILLAFLSGFLGGTCSKVIVTEGFTVSTKELKEKGHDSVLYENPIISAFRGVFLFVGVLTLQYVSSFSDLSGVNNDNAIKKQKDISANYQAILDSVSDTASRNKIMTVMGKEQNQGNDSTGTIVSQIFQLQDSISNKANDSVKRIYNTKIRALRRKVQLPDNADIPGISSSSYFRFAVVVSLLAFICGYDPKRFNVILRMIPILSKTENTADTTQQNQVEKEAKAKGQIDTGSGAG